jgi:heavy metal sensor kinase
LAAAANHNKLLIRGLQYTIPEGQTYLIEIGLTDRDIRSTLRGLLLALALGMPLVVSISVGVSHFLMRKALRPLDEIAGQAERITSRNLGERLPLTKTGDEIERLSVSLNRMVCRLEDAFQHSNRFTADVSHELRTPLTILRGQLEEILRQRARRNQIEMIESALEETEQLARIVDHLLEISRLDAGEGRMEKTRLDLSDLVISTAEQMRLLAEEKSITVRYVTSVGVEIEGNASRLGQVVANLLDNAIKYTPEGGSVELCVAAEESVAVLEIADNGGGIPAEALPHVFERFYRGDKARSRVRGGVGLGLSIVKAICNAHDATIKVWSDEGDGSRFRVEFPLVHRECELASAVPRSVATEDLQAARL